MFAGLELLVDRTLSTKLVYTSETMACWNETSYCGRAVGARRSPRMDVLARGGFRGPGHSLPGVYTWFNAAFRVDVRL